MKEFSNPSFLNKNNDNILGDNIMKDYDKKEHLNDSMRKMLSEIVNIEKNDINNENANMASTTPAGQMMRIASEISKLYALDSLVSEKYKSAHEKGEIHIHDLDFYSSKTTTCLQYDLADMFEHGFNTRHGRIREAKSITTYATLATIIFQTNQNEQHGGQSIPAFDFYMAKGVLKSFKRHFRYRLLNFLEHDYVEEKNNEIKNFINKEIESITVTEAHIQNLAHFFDVRVEDTRKIAEIAYEDTRLETHQAMEGFLHNLNTMHSRGGNQVVFSSINYGTDTSEEGRMVISELLKSTSEGLGGGETPIFPIQIFKVKEGLNFSESDFDKAIDMINNNLDTNSMEELLKKTNIQFDTPNFDLLLLACETSSRRLFPNFLFLDSKFNHHDDWDINDPERYKHEVATMGCRTRVFDNVNGEKTSLGRGNLSFTSINFPRIAIRIRRNIEKKYPHFTKDEKDHLAIEKFKKEVKEKTYFAAEQLLERYNFQKSAYIKQFPFMSANDLWKGMGDLDPEDKINSVLDSGTLGIGFIGGANAMYALLGENHTNNELAYNTLLDSIAIMDSVSDDLKNTHKLNFSILATPAESLAGRFLKIDKEEFGTIENVTDRDYYVNSFHIDVKDKISMFDKIKKEAPFHALTKGGHITYVELDGEAKKNLSVILKIIKTMKDAEIGYGSINHPVDRCRDCGLELLIDDKCPVCGSTNISKIRRITGYLTGDLDSWNSSKKAEERDRVKHV